jgi:hypothetical protein
MSMSSDYLLGVRVLDLLRRQQVPVFHNRSLAFFLVVQKDFVGLVGVEDESVLVCKNRLDQPFTG